ncbi:hypothetical protein NECAME_05701 [Necator americanus]|uniref:Ig-like domain-containing protein n=1 Tax=Necator americanus TaxID=51031 RepID=W2SF64_NECAM|nr:hypothetical protein NECAME_05701 [Necator americanus]ETN68220.1 hypothetical protein NECAME_05701 [Necator americanus]
MLMTFVSFLFCRGVEPCYNVAHELVLAVVCTVALTILLQFKVETFDLPSLLIHTDHIYLLRKLPTNLLCQLSPGWSEARFDSIRWLKDGEDLSELVHKAENKDVAINGSSLVIFGGKQLMEGEYQCVADVSEVRLSNRQVIKTTLVSDPIKLRRARITKFDQTTNHYVHVEQGQVARLPCAGLPDVIPGPAEICFIKSNSDFEGCLSDKGLMESNCNLGAGIILGQEKQCGLSKLFFAAIYN